MLFNMSIISIAQIIFAVIITVLVLLQERSSGVGGAFGGGGAGGVYQTRRGLERIIFYGTIISVIAFTGLAIANLILLAGQ